MSTEELSIEEKVKEIIIKQMGVNKDQVAPETSFINDLGADSLDTVELVMELEDAFDMNIPDEDAEKILKVHLKKTPIAPDVNPTVLAKGTPGFSGADLANMVNEAALIAARLTTACAQNEEVNRFGSVLRDAV